MSSISPEKILRKSPFDHDRPYIEEMVYQGKSDGEIAEHYNVNRDTIWNRRQRWDLPSGSEIKEAMLKDHMTVLWQNGFTIQEMADSLNISLQVAYVKSRLFKLKDVPRLGVNAPNIPMSELSLAYAAKKFDDESPVVVTHNRLPLWVLVPADDYQDLLAGNNNNKEIHE